MELKFEVKLLGRKITKGEKIKRKPVEIYMGIIAKKYENKFINIF